MKPTRAPKIKICCISSRAEADLAFSSGASAIGLVSKMPSGPGVIPEELIREIALAVPPGKETFLLTSRTSSKAIIEQLRRCPVNTVQICDRLSKGSYSEIRDEVPGVSIVQVIHVSGGDSRAEAELASRGADALLLDSGNLALPVKELGGTGLLHDWNLSREIRESVDIPVYLAGGLRAGNVRSAIEAVGPYGVDVCTGVRVDGKLDRGELTAFTRAVLDARSG